MKKVYALLVFLIAVIVILFCRQYVSVDKIYSFKETVLTQEQALRKEPFLEITETDYALWDAVLEHLEEKGAFQLKGSVDFLEDAEVLQKFYSEGYEVKEFAVLDGEIVTIWFGAEERDIRFDLGKDHIDKLVVYDEDGRGADVIYYNHNNEEFTKMKEGFPRIELHWNG